MLYKINFSYKRGNQNSKKEMILKQIQPKLILLKKMYPKSEIIKRDKMKNYLRLMKN